MHILDWFPTLATLIDYQPAEPISWDGIDISAAVLENQALPERDLYWIWNEHTNRWASRLGDWKIAHYGRNQPASPTDWQLFNLKADPREQQNVATEHPEIVSALHERFVVQRGKDRKRKNP